ncbi:preprotein translocase subunit SecE [Metaclostridioides mangenotii]|uniref:preprotein translocase subunit SecE n=1 Tax=Metaclostridioides mangenotii TaxID=1540 RepID=UPI000B0CB367|nr:preprotein translocase subunit SecE [Clostridioides mangenotii]
MTEESKKEKFSLFRYLKETRQELKRVTWPTGKELLKTLDKFSCSCSFTIIVWG